jgi:hypothetical protein
MRAPSGERERESERDAVKVDLSNRAVNWIDRLTLR